MEYKDFIKSGNKVAFIPQSHHPFFGWGWDVGPQIVTIGEYPPYYRNGEADPTPEEYDRYCYVEIVEDIDGEAQIELSELFAIIPESDEKLVVYDTSVCKLIGHIDYEEDDYAVIEYDGELKIIHECEFQLRRTIEDLSYDELKQLWTEIQPGSIYLYDYTNSLGISAEDAESACEEYGSETGWNRDENWDEEYNNPDKFAEYILVGLP